jgi:hypothetical protein
MLVVIVAGLSLDAHNHKKRLMTEARRDVENVPLPNPGPPAAPAQNIPQETSEIARSHPTVENQPPPESPGFETEPGPSRGRPDPDVGTSGNREIQPKADDIPLTGAESSEGRKPTLLPLPSDQIIQRVSSKRSGTRSV